MHARAPSKAAPVASPEQVAVSRSRWWFCVVMPLLVPQTFQYEPGSAWKVPMQSMSVWLDSVPTARQYASSPFER